MDEVVAGVVLAALLFGWILFGGDADQSPDNRLTLSRPRDLLVAILAAVCFLGGALVYLGFRLSR